MWKERRNARPAARQYPLHGATSSAVGDNLHQAHSLGCASPLPIAPAPGAFGYPEQTLSLATLVKHGSVDPSLTIDSWRLL
jgi:hypothetical protein